MNVQVIPQKPEVLLERIIRASSNRVTLWQIFSAVQGQLLVAAKNGRKFITCDESIQQSKPRVRRLANSKNHFFV